MKARPCCTLMMRHRLKACHAHRFIGMRMYGLVDLRLTQRSPTLCPSTEVSATFRLAREVEVPARETAKAEPGRK